LGIGFDLPFQIDIVEHPEAEILDGNVPSAEDVVVRADDPDCAVGLQDAATLALSQSRVNLS
jgi:hypothetical protein